MKISVKKIVQCFFYIAYFFFLAFSFFGHIENIGGYLKELTNISLLILFFTVIIQVKKYTKEELLKIFLLLLLAFIYAFCNADYTLLKIILMLSVMKNINFEKCISFDLFVRIIFIIIMLMLFYSGIAPDVTSYYNGETRHSLGFTNPNTLGMNILILCFDIININKKKISFKTIFIIVALLVFGEIYAGSRTATLVLSIAIILSIIYKYRPQIYDKKIVKIIISNSAIIFSIGIFIMYLLYTSNNSIGIKLNEILSYRLYNIQRYSQEYDISLFGNNLGTLTLTLDTTIAYCLFGCGISGLIIYIYSCQKLFKNIYKNNNIILAIIWFCFMIYSMSEKLWLCIDYNIFVASFSFVLFKNKDMLRNKIKEINEKNKNIYE